MEKISKMVAEKPVVIFSKSKCGICHSVKSLIGGFGAHLMVYELDEIPGGKEIEQALARLMGNPTPAVFIGGKLVGGASEINALHLGGSLHPLLISAGAIFL